MDDNPILEELRRIRKEQFAAYGYDIGRHMRAMRRQQFLNGNDVVARSKETGEFEVIFKGTGMKFRIEDDQEISPGS